MPTEDTTRLLANWRAETEAVFLYERLAQAEPHPELKNIYQRLAETEKGHARLWADKLAALGAAPPQVKVSWRIRWLSWLARRFGNGLVLSTLADLEKNASSAYDAQPDAQDAGLPRDERSHARIFGYLAQGTRGLEGSALARLEGRHRAGGNALRAGVLGANDGLISNFCLVMGIAGAEVHTSWIVITGFTGMLAGAISMALGEWLSVQSSRELYQNQIRIEKSELETAPEEERDELALIYQAKGLPAEEARRFADRLLTDPSSALDTLSREELGINPQELGGSAWVAAGTSFLLFAVGAAIPVVPFLFVSGPNGALASAVVSGGGLFVIGAAITLVTGRSWIWAGWRQVLFGLAAAAVTFGLGHWLGVRLGG
jgi:VIT1/CCC1 family predicted Fe2+/Mn2+ transporter